MFKLKFYGFVICIIFACTSLTGISLASSEARDIRDFETWRSDPSLRRLGFEYLKTLKERPEELDNETSRKHTESAFSGLLYHYERLDYEGLSISVAEKEDFARKIREFESLLAMHVISGKINPANLWLEGMPELEVVLVTSENIDKLVSEGKIRGDIPPDTLDTISRGGSSYCDITKCIVSPRFFRLPSTFSVSQLLVGGERKTPEERQDCYMLNFVSSAYPDILGDAKNPSSLVAIPDSKFMIIEFNFLDHSILLDEEVLREYFRILAPGGTFTFKTNHNSKEYYAKKIKAEIVPAWNNLKKLFGNEVTKPTFNEDPDWKTKHEAHYFFFQAIK